jgi:Spy/CpxP family protein refolding chaperone
MNTIKRFNLVVVLLFTTFILLSSNLFAQQRQEQGPPPIPDETQINKMVEDLSSELTLTPTQKTKILALYTDHFAEVNTSMKGQRKSREEMESLKSNFEKQVKDLLTKDQKAKFEKYMKNLRPESNKQRPKH